MLSYLEELRRRPEHERRRVILVWTISITVLIVLLWLSTLKSSISAELQEESYAKSPFGEIKKTIGGAWGKIKGIYSR